MNNEFLSDPLWQRIDAMDLDASTADMPYSKRLARENGWSAAFTWRVIGEYKRFLYMATISRLPVTPSDEVDQAWHLHLLYSRHYWETLCGKILCRPLHHEPTQGGDEEKSKYFSHYTRTLDFYRSTFGRQPPADTWPRQRFSRAAEYRRVDLGRYLVFPRLRMANAALAMSSVTLTGCVGMLGEREWKVLGVFVLGMIVLFALKRGGGGRGCSSGCGGCGGGD